MAPVAIKYPDSELRVLLYRQTMHSYQSANNADKMMDAGRKVLKIDSSTSVCQLEGSAASIPVSVLRCPQP